MNFAHNYINNFNELKETLVKGCIADRISEDESNTIYIDEEEFDGGLRLFHFLNEEKEPFCKIEYTDKGMYFYERKQS